MTTKLISVVRTGAPCNVFDLVLDKGIDFETGQARQVSETTAQALLSDPAGGWQPGTTPPPDEVTDGR